MVDKIQDLNLPASVVTRLIKESLPDGINIGKEARSAIAKAASIFSKLIDIIAARKPKTQTQIQTFLYRNLFIVCELVCQFFPISAVIYLTSSTAAAAKKQKHKSLSSDNVFSALEEIEFENFIEPLRDALETFRKVSKEKKSSKANDSKIDETPNTNGKEDTADEDMTEETPIQS